MTMGTQQADGQGFAQVSAGPGRRLLNRIVADYDHVSAVRRRRRFERERRPNDRPGLRAERQPEEHPENDFFHPMVFICSICAIEIGGSLSPQFSVHTLPRGKARARFTNDDARMTFRC